MSKALINTAVPFIFFTEGRKGQFLASSLSESQFWATAISKRSKISEFFELGM